MRSLLLITSMVPPLVLATLATAAMPQEEAAPQNDWMVHIDRSSGEWRFIPERPVLLPGGTLQLMVFGNGQYSLVLDDHPTRAADIATSEGTIRTAELTAPETPGEYAFHDKYRPEARGVLVVRQATTPNAAPTIGVIPGGYESRFSPERIEVDPGARVTFLANGSFGHNLQAMDGSFSGGDLPPGGSSTFDAPTAPGEYPFECRFHAAQGMTGTLVVRAASAGLDAASPPEEPRDVAGLALGGTLVALGICTLGLGLRARNRN